MDKQQIIARAIELIYISRGVPEHELEGSLGDVITAQEAVDNDCGTSLVSLILSLGLQRHGCPNDNEWEDAEFIEALVKGLS
jgi:hypothetical protein